MKITLDWLKEKSSCKDGKEYFAEHFPDGAEYQDVLDHLAEENNVSWACWLMQNAGQTNAVLEVDELISENSVFLPET